MDIAGTIKRVVKIQRVTHSRIDQGRLGRWHASAEQPHTALFAPSPVFHYAGQLGDTWSHAAPQRCAQRI